MEIGGPGEVGPRAQGAVEEGPRGGAGPAPIQPPRMEDVPVRGPPLSQELVITLHVWVRKTAVFVQPFHFQECSYQSYRTQLT